MEAKQEVRSSNHGAGVNAQQRREREIARQRQVNTEVEAAIGNSEICSHCKATLDTFADKCSAPLEVECPGFKRIDEVRRPIVARIYGFKP